MPPMLNIAEAESRQITNGDIFEARLAPLAERLGGRAIAANVTTVPPGKAAFPLHHHHGNEEHFFVISGTGVLRLGAATHAVKPGDYIVTPPGGAELAHQLVNTGATDLVYLALSTTRLARSRRLPGFGQDRCRRRGMAQRRFLLGALFRA